MVTLGLGVVSTPTYQPSYRQFIKYFYPQTFTVCGGGEVSDRTNFLLDNIYIDFLSEILHPAPLHQQARLVGVQESDGGK